MSTVEIGRTYCTRSGADVEIVGTGTDHIGAFYAGIVRAYEEQADRIVLYNMYGVARIPWGGALDVILPRRYVSLDDALSLIRDRMRDAATDQIPLLTLVTGDLTTMPFKEMTAS